MAPITLTPGVPREIPVDGVHVTSKVTITVPAQLDGGAVTVTTEALPARANVPDGPDFKLGRLIANVRLSKTTATLNPPARLKFAIISEDVSRAKGQSFKLAYWDQAARRWMILKDNIPCAVGDVEVDFSKLGDPPSAVGP